MRRVSYPHCDLIFSGDMRSEFPGMQISLDSPTCPMSQFSQVNYKKSALHGTMGVASPCCQVSIVDDPNASLKYN